MRTTYRDIFTTITTEGALLPADLLGRIAQGGPDVGGLSPDDYHLPRGEKLNEAASRAWNRLLGHWTAFRAVLDRLQHDTVAGGTITSETRERWLLPLFQELGYGRLPAARAQEIDGKTYPISHQWGNVPIHLVGAGVDLDRRTAGVAGASRTSPHSLVQEFLNANRDNLWGFVSNGLTLRILRDNSSLTRQAYVEFDLKGMMDGEVYSDFVMLWLLCHQSRVEGDRPEECRLEQWSKAAQEQGTRALDQLREGVEEAISALGRGFLSHPANRALRARISAPEGGLSAQDYYRQLLRMVYRFIFLFVAEDRDLLLHPDATSEARRIYSDYYSTARLRNMAIRGRGTRHSDLYYSLYVVMQKLGEDNGCMEIGLPALNSFLFERGGLGSMPDLEGCQISNYDLLEAIRHLAYTVDSNVRRPVDYRNMGSEELGSVYEALLELHPDLNVVAGTFTLVSASGNERKTTGSYYTPTSLITSLLDSALDPVLDEAEKKPNPEAAILALRVCDPACGSGHFLVAAAHRIARRLARVRTGDDEPSPQYIRSALRAVIGNCIYGVDLNPMAIELCKVSLWMEALEPGKPLSFLDAHIKVGNSLLGATPALITGGIPDEAFEPIEGDLREVCTEYKKRNREARKGQQSFLDMAPPWERLGNFAAGMASLDEIDDSTVEGIHRKQEQYESLVGSSDYIYNGLLADAWCAAFVWKKNREFAYPIWEQVFRRIERNPFDTAIWMREEIVRLKEQYGFFHWHLEFPTVFRVPGAGKQPTNEAAGWIGGFDVVLGNPPWERIKLQEQEWFAVRRPDIAGAPNAAARKRMISALKADDPALYVAFQEDQRQAEGESHLVRHSGRFPLCGRGDVNTYAVFAETARTIISPVGRAGIIVPSGIATDDTTKFFFQDLMDTNSLVSLYSFENEEFIFPAVHHATKFCLLTAAGSRSSQPLADFVFFARQTTDINDVYRHFTLTANDIALLNPNTGTCPIFRSSKDAEITKQIYRRVPILMRDHIASGNPWDLVIRRVFDMNKPEVMTLCSREPHVEDTRMTAMYEAKMVHQFDYRFGTYEGQTQAQANQGKLPELDEYQHGNPALGVRPRYWIPAPTVDDALPSMWNKPWLLVWRDITSAVTTRTVISCIVPRTGTDFTLRVGFPQRRSSDAGAFLMSTFNCFAFDYCARQMIGGTHLSDYIMKQLPVLPPETYHQPTPWERGVVLQGWLMPRVLELTYTAHDLTPFARDCGYNGPPFTWDEERRSLLRAELDAAYFHLYGIGPDDMDYIMDTFAIVKRKDEARYGEYRTKRVIMEIYSAMQHSIESGQPYTTQLDPPPAGGAKLHPPVTPSPTLAPRPVATPPTPTPTPTIATEQTGHANMPPTTTPLPEPQQDVADALSTLRSKLHYPVAHTDLTREEVRTAIKGGLITHGGWRKGKIYGTLSCWSGKKMRPQERVFFASEAQAISLGYRPCGHCMPEKYAQWKARVKQSVEYQGSQPEIDIAGYAPTPQPAAPESISQAEPTTPSIQPPPTTTTTPYQQSLFNAPTPPPAPAAPSFRPGDRVRHAQFGTGRVVEGTPSGNDYAIAVRFDRAGLRRLLASMAKLEKI